MATPGSQNSSPCLSLPRAHGAGRKDSQGSSTLQAQSHHRAPHRSLQPGLPGTHTRPAQIRQTPAPHQPVSPARLAETTANRATSASLCFTDAAMLRPGPRACAEGTAAPSAAASWSSGSLHAAEPWSMVCAFLGHRPRGLRFLRL